MIKITPSPEALKAAKEAASAAAEAGELVGRCELVSASVRATRPLGLSVVAFYPFEGSPKIDIYRKSGYQLILISLQDLGELQRATPGTTSSP